MHDRRTARKPVTGRGELHRVDIPKRRPPVLIHRRAPGHTHLHRGDYESPPPSVRIVLPKPIRAAIDAERRNLHKVDAMLGCLVIALEYGQDGNATDEPDYADAVRALRAMIASAAAQLDPSHLEHLVSEPVASDA
jgi:hypothetical protein